MIKNKIAVVFFFVLNFLLIDVGGATENNTCEKASIRAISEVDAARDYCFEQVDPNAEHYDVEIIEKCLSKCQKGLSLEDYAEKVCSLKGGAILAEIEKSRRHLMETMYMMGVLKDMEEGTTTKEEGLYKLLVKPDSLLSYIPEWSENPGAFEQHLMRRYKNPLFPKDRRKISQEEITSARERDNRDYEEVKSRLNDLLQDIVSLPDSIDFATTNDFLDRLQDLTLDAMGVGGQASDVALLAQELRNNFLATWKTTFVDHPNLKRLLEKAERFDQLYAQRFHTPFAAQILREDKSIPPSEVIPAILMEGPNEIAETIKSINDPNIQIQFQREAIRLLQAAKAEGAHIENLESILKALEVSPS
jgi:hypothetical protein